MKKQLPVLFLIIGLTLVSLLGLFYFFSLKPKLILPTKLLEMEKVLTKAQANLLQNRLSIMSLVNLDPKSSYFSGYKEDSLNKATETANMGVEELKQPTKIQTPPGETSDLLNDLYEQLPLLISENKEIYEKQRAYLDQLVEINDINKNIYTYNPQLDLGSVDLEKNTDEAIDRTYRAIEGLESIKTDLAEYDAKSTVSLSNTISETQSLLQVLATHLENNDLASAGQTFSAISEGFGKMRELGLGMELTIIRSPEMITLLTDQTNLILQYEFWLKKINLAQKDLSKIDLNKIFSR